VNLDQLEKRLQTLVEVHLLNYLPIKKKEGLVAQQIAAAIQTNLQEEGDQKIASNAYTLSAHPSVMAGWKKDPALIERFRSILETVAEEAEIDFGAPLSFLLASDPALNPDEIRILASQRVEKLSETQGMETKKEGNATSEKIPANAFLIVHGTKVFPLNKAVVNIGRRMENELTIDDPRVSRNHAQLRAVNGRYVIFDLNSTGGTYVNSQRSHQSVLYPGDVISLAGVPLIFGQDNPPRRADLSETAPFNSSGSERPTALLPKHPADDDTIL
jgi:hypothetical protein